MRLQYQINDNWFFEKNDKVLSSMTELTYDTLQEVSIPHTWNAFDGQDGGSDYYRGHGVYYREIPRPSVPEDYRLYLEFGAVNSVADIYADGVHLYHHEGGYSIFRVEITDCYKDGKPFLLTVLADNTILSNVYPQMADFTFYGGIYREVALIAVPPTHFSLDFYGAPGVSVSSSLQDGRAYVNLKAYVKDAVCSDMVQFRMYGSDEAEEMVYEAFVPATEVTKATLEIVNPHLWQATDDPYLYDVEIRLVRHNEVLDAIHLRHGIREYSVDPEKGFILNGIPTPLRGVSRHQDRLLIGNALEAVDHMEDAELIAELGANTVRLAHYQHSREFYDLCDEYGFVVWAEIPFISVMNKDPKAHDNALEQMKELVYQNFNYTSICFWGISNEITIGGDVPGLYENLCTLHALVKELDSTRLTTMAQVSMLPKESKQNFITDVMAYNIYFGWYGGKYEDNEVWMDEFHAMYPTRPLGISEYGCEGIISWHSDTPKCKDYTEEYQALYHEHMAKIIEERPYLWATHIWNMFDFGCDARDEGGVRGRNNKGLVTLDREIKKDSYYVYKAYWSKKEVFAHIAGRRFALRHEAKTSIKVYSNLPELTLVLNGREIGTKKAEKVFTFDDVVLREGPNYLHVKQGDKVYDSITLTKVDTAYEGYVMPPEEDDVREGVKNWFEDIDTEGDIPELTFKEGYFSIRDTVGDILAHEEASDVMVAAMRTFTSMRIKRTALSMMSSQSLENLAGMLAQGEEKAKKLLAFTNVRLQQVKK